MNTEELLASFGDGDPDDYLGRNLLLEGDRKLAASAFDRAFGLAQDNGEVSQERRRLLDDLAVERCSITFRYIPAGTFLMGSDSGEADEKPKHRVQLDGFWISDTPVSWSNANLLLGWGAPADFRHRDKKWCKNRDLEYFSFLMGEQIRLQYCEDHTEGARDWHAHVPPASDKHGQLGAMFGKPPRSADKPYSYLEKPMAGVSFLMATSVCKAASAWGMKCRLPTEAEWEKSARGGLVDCRYPWGNNPAGPDNCDCNRFNHFAIQKSRTFPPNGYGLYATSGGVCEWTSDWYDAEYYSISPVKAPWGPDKGIEMVQRGGSWADCPEVVTNSYRVSRTPNGGFSPNIGFRICVTEFGEIPEGNREADLEHPLVQAESPNLLHRLRRIFGK